MPGLLSAGPLMQCGVNCSRNWELGDPPTAITNPSVLLYLSLALLHYFTTTFPGLRGKATLNPMDDL